MASTTRKPERTNLGDVRQRFVQRSREYLSRTSLHGASYIIDNNIHPFRRCLWFLLVTGLSLSLLVTLHTEVRRYLEYPVSTIVRMNYLPRLLFPAVTVCNYNRYRKSVIGGTPEDALMRHLYFTGSIYPTNPDGFDWTTLENSTSTVNRSLFELEAAHPKESLIESCRFKGDGFDWPCGPENFSTTFTEFGVCYSFNDDLDNAITTNLFGSHTGLRIRLFTNEDEYTHGPQTGSGFKINLHSPGSLPQMKQFGFSISTGVEAMISTRTEKWEHLPHPYVTNCSHGQLRYSTLTYSYSACCLEKMTDFVSEKCGCKEIHMPGPYRECNLRESLTCTSPLIDTFGHQNTEFCNVACEEVNYIPHISYANIPSKPLVDDLWDKKNMSRDFLRDNYADVSVFLEDLNCKQITFVPAITLNSIWSNFGGLMGLCLGASLITIVECIDFILFCCCKHR